MRVLRKSSTHFVNFVRQAVNIRSAIPAVVTGFGIVTV